MPQLTSNNKGQPGGGTPAIPGEDYSDFDRGFDFEEISSGADAFEVNSAAGGDFPNFNAIPSITGKFTNARGPLKSTGHVSPAWFTRSTLSDLGWDIRGDPSMTIMCWLKVPDNTDGAPIAVSIHDPGAANGQAFQLYAYHSTVGNGAPLFQVLDGVTPFVGENTSHLTAAAPINNAWYFIGASRDSVADEIRLFYGRAAGDSYFTSKAWTAGFGYDGVTGLTANEGVHIGRWDGLSQDSVIDGIDNLMFWNSGFAATEADFANVWNNHDGRDFGNLVLPGTPGTGGPVVHNDHGRAGNIHGGNSNRP